MTRWKVAAGDRRTLVSALCLLLLGSAAVGCSTRGAVVPLAKADGWSGGSDLSPYAVLEIAFDRGTAEEMWRQNVPAGLQERSGVPAESGIYGELANVDFEQQAVVLWSSGQSSSCPEWLDNLTADNTGTVEVKTRSVADSNDGCTADYATYRMIVSVGRDQVPRLEDLPTTDVVGVPDGLVTPYPADR